MTMYDKTRQDKNYKIAFLCVKLKLSCKTECGDSQIEYTNAFSYSNCNAMQVACCQSSAGLTISSLGNEW